jgi:hypothetical protein
LAECEQPFPLPEFGLVPGLIPIAGQGLEHGVSESGISGERDIGQWVMMRVSSGFNESAESAFKNIEKMEIILIENFFGPIEKRPVGRGPPGCEQRQWRGRDWLCEGVGY